MKTEKIYFHVVEREGKISVIEANTNECKNVPGSRSCFRTKEGADRQAAVTFPKKTSKQI